MLLPRMRTATGVLTEIQKMDPNTEITLHYIRNLIHNNKIPVVYAGRKKLVDLDAVLEFLEKGDSVRPVEKTAYGRIRPVDVNEA